jgi:hypothetical protein
MKDITEEVKPLFKSYAMSCYDEVKAIEDDYGEKRVMCRSVKENPYGHGQYNVFEYHPESDLSPLNPGQFELTKDEAEELLWHGLEVQMCR